jgi:hypothetical protein
MLFIIEKLLFKGVNEVNKGQIATVGKIVSHKLNPEIPIFGSSVAWNHFNPEIISSRTNKTCYNFGLYATSLIQYQGLLREFIDYSDSDILVIAGTYDEFSKRKAISQLYKYIAYIENNNLYHSLKDIDPSLLWKMKHIPFYSLTTLEHSFYEYSASGWLGISHPQDSKEIKGFVPEEKEWAPSGRDLMKVAPVDSDVVDVFRQMVIYANEKGKTVVIVIPPIYHEGANQIQGLDKVINLYKSIAGEKNYFFDYTESHICLDQSLFYDNTHMNIKGANAFSADFANKLDSLLNKKSIDRPIGLGLTKH